MYGSLINAIALQTARWIDAHGGITPARIRVAKDVAEHLEEEAKLLGFRDKKDMGGKIHIMGIEVEVDPALAVCVIDAKNKIAEPVCTCRNSVFAMDIDRCPVHGVLG